MSRALGASVRITAGSELRFGGRGAVVTGAASELGDTLVRTLLAEGANVVAIDAREPTFAGLTAEQAARCLAFTVDVSSERSVSGIIDEVVEEWPVRHLFNAAEARPTLSVPATTLAAWDEVFAVNARAAFLMCKYVLPTMIRCGGGSIVNFASLPAASATPGGVAYYASQGAIVAMTRALAAEHAADHVRVNCVRPGWTDRPPAGRLADRADGHDPAGEAVSSAEVMDRTVALALRLAGDAASAVTGAVVSVVGRDADRREVSRRADS